MDGSSQMKFSTTSSWHIDAAAGAVHPITVILDTVILEQCPLKWNHHPFVMAGLDPAISLRPCADPRVKPGDDGEGVVEPERNPN
jgi:hypothetical protein